MADEELTFTFEDLLGELTSSLGGEQGITASEAVEELAKRGRRRSVVWVRDKLKGLLRAGRLVRGMGVRVGLDGIERPVPVYRLKRPADAGSAERLEA